VKALVSKLDGLPLALATAGAYLKQVSGSFEDYLNYSNKSWLNLQKTTRQLESYHSTLYTTLNTSYEHIKRQSPSAGKLLQLWAYFDNQDLWYSLLAAGVQYGPEWFRATVGDKTEFKKTMALLRQHALVQYHSDRDSYSIHNCVHDWTLNVLNAGANAQMSTLALICVGHSLVDEEKLGSKNATLQQRLFPHAIRCAEMVDVGSMIRSFKYQSLLHESPGSEALEVKQGAMKKTDASRPTPGGSDKAWKGSHRSILAAVSNLGVIFLHHSDEEKAERMLKWAVQGSDTLLGEEGWKALSTLATLYMKQRKIEKAESLFVKVLQVQERVLGPSVRKVRHLYRYNSVQHSRYSSYIGTVQHGTEVTAPCCTVPI
jgi:hypothetical protein